MKRVSPWHFTQRAAFTLAAAILFAPAALLAQAGSATSSSSSTSDRWLHVRVINSDNKGETVRVNVPIEMAEKVLPAINKNELHDGKVRLNHSEMNGVDLRAILDALRSSKDGEYVAVQATDCDVRVAKQNGYMFVHVTEKNAHGKAATEKSRVEVKVPMKVVEALFSAGKDEIDLVAALHALSAHAGDTELVSVKSDDSTVRVWVDSKNVAD